MCAHVIATTRSCRDGDCPTLVRATTAAGQQVIVQGYVVDNPAEVLPEGYTVPAGESVVAIPADVFDHLVQQYLADRVQA
jgi:hypothetical protein